MGWFVISIFPIANAMNIVLIQSNFFPLNTIRFSFAVTLGVILSNFHKDIPVQYLLKVPIIKLVILFASFITVISLDNNLLPTFSNFLPSLFIVFVLPYVIIKDEQDLHKIVKIFIWQGGIIAFFVVLEQFTGFNPYDIFFKINSQYYFIDHLEKTYYRAGFKRAVGLAGNPVFTAYLLAVYFPLALWYSLKKKLNKKLPIIIISIALILLQTRAAIIALILVFTFLFLYTLFKKKQSGLGIKLFFKILILFSILFLFAYLSYSDSIVLFINFFSEFLSESGGFGIESKISRIPIAINYFFQSPFWGSGLTPREVYEKLMNYNDLPGPFIYLLSGGLLLAGIYFSIIWTLSNSTFKIIKQKNLTNYQNKLLIFAGCSFIAGSVCTLSLWTEKHVLVMYMLFISIYKIYVLEFANKIKFIKYNDQEK